MVINIHSVPSQCSDSLEAGPYTVCLLAEAGDFPSLQNIRLALGPILFSGCCGFCPNIQAADA